jgi:pyruvate dehydrogenase E2 component (dihydrolipoamide acetyltransferase)
MRKTIADNMVLSSRETAPVVLIRSVDITELQNLRKVQKSLYEARGQKAPSFNDIMIKAIAMALEKHPRLNATFQNNMIRTYSDININMAIAVDAGLVTPVIHNANRLSVDEISAKAKEFSQKAAANELRGTDYSGGTFTVSNLGMLDIEVSTPILNPPQVAILAIGMVQPYLTLEDGKLVERFKTFLSLTVDHRIVDGYPGAQYLYTLAEILTKNPATIWA